MSLRPDTPSTVSDSRRFSNGSLKSSPKDFVDPMENDELPQKSGSKVLPKDEDTVAENPILPTETGVAENENNNDLDEFFKKLEDIPPSVCEACEQARQVDEKGVEQCSCTREAYQLLLDTLLTDSNSSEDYTDQETSHFDLVNRGKRPVPKEVKLILTKFKFA